MTIRYSCEKCESVLKIRDELAGTNAKCPKCKTAFVIPEPVAVKASSSVPDVPKVMLDMPQEITPAVNPADTDLLDIARAAAATAAAATAESAGAPKPSIADLMREHEASKKKKSESKKKELDGIPGVSAMVTSGSAADVLNRNYDQKRGNSSDPPPLTREEQRAADQKEALKEFAGKGAAGLAGLSVVLYFLITWMTGESYPDLVYVSGVVKLNNQPLVGARVEFAPTSAPGQQPLDNMQPSTAYTNQLGEYILYYDEINGVEGALPGLHNVNIMTASGGIFPLPVSEKQKTLTDTATIDFSISQGR